MESIMAKKSNTAFLLIDNQQGFSNPTHWGPSRSNPFYESNITTLLQAFRSRPSPKPLIVHIQHLSTSANSPLHPSCPGSAFYANSTPLPDEPVLTKSVNSAFIGTSLEDLLRANEVRKLYIAGLSTDHCVSTTARMAGNMHVTDYVDADGHKIEGDVVLIGDATAAWKKPSGEWDAEVVHAVHLESLKEFARIVRTEDVLSELGVKVSS
jgi:nicotinamidase-related amidase